MIRVAVMYPQSEGKSFNLEYYMNKHMKLVKEKLGPLGLVSSEVDAGISGMGDSDIPNYTDTEPVVQISNFQRL